jgi:hypothetical protein
MITSPGRTSSHQKRAAWTGQHHPECDLIRIDEAPFWNIQCKPPYAHCEAIDGNVCEEATLSSCLSCTMSTSEPRVHCRS